MNQHVKVVGAVHLVFGAIKVLTGIGILVFFVGAGVGAGLLASAAGKAEARAEERLVVGEEGASVGDADPSEPVREERFASSSTEISNEGTGLAWVIGILGGVVGVILGGACILWGAFRMLVGFGLLRFRPWARAGAVVLAVFDLPGFPFFTLFAVYALWAVLAIESRDLFQARG
ncbi:MAG: hypothetical protein ACYS47_08270 [Planctomycetota bacterium]|jgi:hypothetical protein